MDENKLVKLALTNKDAMNRLIKMNYPFVYGYLLKLCMNEDLARDLTQDTMIKAVLYIKQFKFKSKFSTWLISIASNNFKNYIKKNKVVYSPLDHLITDSFNLEEDIMNKDLVEKILAYLSTLKPKQSMPFILKHYHGYSYEEISQILSCPVGTVRSRIHNTIKKIQAEFGGEYYVM